MSPDPPLLRWGDPSGERLVLFVPGFLVAPSAYRALVGPLAGPDVEVVVPQFDGRGLRALSGHPSPREEAAELATLAPRLADGRELWLAGHSRGGQVAWLAAGTLEPAGVAVVDPVDGSGPRSAPDATAAAAGFSAVPLVVGLGIPGRCAPAGLGHERFAAAAPRRVHVVVPGAGHADVLTGPDRLAGRALCGGGPAPDRVRRTVTALLAAHLAGRLVPGGWRPGSERALPVEPAWR